jgi:NADH-quinone oxidoreductase subunit E
MSWIAEDKRNARMQGGRPLLTDEMKRHVEQVYFPRYPTRRACLLPVLHLVQHEYNWIPPEALAEVGDFLGLAPAEVLDTATFYEEYWLRNKGKYLVQVCRSLACEVCGADKIIEGLIENLAIELGETTDDERFTLVELECLGSCGTAPVALVNDVLHENITTESLLEHLRTLPADPHDYRDPFIDFEVPVMKPGA